jgi:hypothetical protein
VSLKDEVTARLPWLFDDLGFRITLERETSGIGSSIVELRSESMHLRFLRGSHLALSVASPEEPSHWLDLDSLWHALTGNWPHPEVEGWGWFFRDHYAEISAAVGPNFPQTKQIYDRREKELADVIARNLPRPRLTFRKMWKGPLGRVLAAGLIAWEVFKR